MSYPVRVSVSRSIEEVVSGADQSVVRMHMTHILPEAEMQDILREHLAARGWNDAGGGRFTKAGVGGEALEVDLGGMTLTASAQAAGKIQRTETAEATIDSDAERYDKGARQRLEDKTAKELEKRIRISDEERVAKRRELEARAAAALTVGEESRRREFNEVMAEVHAEALKRKAATMGVVTSVEEKNDGSSHELTITVTE